MDNKDKANLFAQIDRKASVDNAIQETRERMANDRMRELYAEADREKAAMRANSSRDLGYAVPKNKMGLSRNKVIKALVAILLAVGSIWAIYAIMPDPEKATHDITYSQDKPAPKGGIIGIFEKLADFLDDSAMRSSYSGDDWSRDNDSGYSEGDSSYGSK